MPTTPVPTLRRACFRGNDEPLDSRDRALARWARRLAQDPNSTTAADVEMLPAEGFDETQIFAITLYTALRIAFATVNDALGARPDRQLGAEVPPEVRAAVDFGRPIA